MEYASATTCEVVIRGMEEMLIRNGGSKLGRNHFPSSWSINKPNFLSIQVVSFRIYCEEGNPQRRCIFCAKRLPDGTNFASKHVIL